MVKSRDFVALISFIPIDQLDNETSSRWEETFNTKLIQEKLDLNAGGPSILYIYDFSFLSTSDVDGGRRSTILSIIPKLRASLAVIKWSRSSALSVQSKNDETTKISW